MFDWLKKTVSGTVSVRTMFDLLKIMNDMKADELRITAGQPPVFCVKGVPGTTTLPALSADQTRNLLFSLFTREQKERFEKEQKIDIPLGIKGLGRFNAEITTRSGILQGIVKRIL